jgi:hypothetical protein
MKPRAVLGVLAAQGTETGIITVIKPQYARGVTDEAGRVRAELH